MIALTRRDGYPSKRAFGRVGESQIDSRRATTMLTYWIDDELYCFDCGDDHEEAEEYECFDSFICPGCGEMVNERPASYSESSEWTPKEDH